jgi:hypothetical protein
MHRYRRSRDGFWDGQSTDPAVPFCIRPAAAVLSIRNSIILGTHSEHGRILHCYAPETIFIPLRIHSPTTCY